MAIMIPTMSAIIPIINKITPVTIEFNELRITRSFPPPVVNGMKPRKEEKKV
jgi:hypothetical protein